MVDPNRTSQQSLTSMHSWFGSVTRESCTALKGIKALILEQICLDAPEIRINNPTWRRIHKWGINTDKQIPETCELLVQSCESSFLSAFERCCHVSPHSYLHLKDVAQTWPTTGPFAACQTLVAHSAQCPQVKIKYQKFGWLAGVFLGTYLGRCLSPGGYPWIL